MCELKNSRREIYISAAGGVD